MPEGSKMGYISISNASRQRQEEETKLGWKEEKEENGSNKMNMNVSHCHTPEHMLPVVANMILIDPDQKHIKIGLSRTRSNE